MSAPPPKRDKFAALAAAQQQPSAATSSTDADTAAAGRAAPPPKRDKFASLAAAAAAGSQQEEVGHDSVRSSHTVHKKKREDKDLLLQKKQLHQRDAVWDDLDRAEAALLQLLQTAEQTATALARQTTTTTIDDDDDDDDQLLPQLAADYQERLAEIHRVLAPHAVHVQPYQPQHAAAAGDPHRVYRQRVEHRLAVSQRALLQEMVQAAQQRQQEGSEGGGGGGGEGGGGNQSMGSSTNSMDPSLSTATSKRKREDGV